MSTADNNNGQPQPCANEECSFSGHAGFDNYCSVCYKSHVNNVSKVPAPKDEEMKDEESSEAKVNNVDQGAAFDSPKVAASPGQNQEEEEKAPAKKVQKNKKRCFECRKKVGIVGFECRCGFVYCGKHRFPEEHQCEFNHASFEKQQLVKKANATAEAKKVDVL